jgi:hypothetical protein
MRPGQLTFAAKVVARLAGGRSVRDTKVVINMKLFRTFILLSLMLVFGSTFGMSVKTDYDKSFDLNRLKTFTFKEQRRSDGNLLQRNTLVDNRIKDALRRDLEARGFRYQPDGQTDFIVAYYARQTERAEAEPLGYGMPLRWRWGWGPRVWTRYYTQGSLVVDFIDPTDNQLIWRGRATDTVKGLDQSEKQISQGADQLIKHFVKDSSKKR